MRMPPPLSAGSAITLHLIDAETLATESPCRIGWLSAEERQRAARLVRPRDRMRFVIFRSELRAVLGRAMGLPPQDVPLHAQPGEKPRLAGAAGPGFNLSHCNGIGLIALGAGLEIGIDIEQIRPVRGVGALAARHLASEELEIWRTLPETARDEVFLRFWTGKEAYVKGTGEGLALPFSRIRLQIGPDGGPKRISVAGRPEVARDWRVSGLDLPAGLVGALAWARGPCH